MPDIILTSTTGNRSTTLWNAQDDQREVQGNTRVDAPPTFQSDEALLTQLEGQEQFSLSGIATGNRISNQSGYSDDPLTALAEWVVEYEAYCNGQQGDGHTLSLPHRNLTYNGAISNISWEREAGAKYEVRWQLTFKRGRALQSPNDTSLDSVSPTSNAYLDDGNIYLHNIERKRVSKKQKIKTYPVAYADPGDNELLDKSGVVRRWTVIGSVENDTGDPDDERNQIDADIRALVGQDTAVTFTEPFPGRTKTVMVDSYETTREAGVTRLGKYALELVEGVAQ